ncbi:MAG: hypothetical protein AAGD10_12065 [Myxococcota bacterium]
MRNGWLIATTVSAALAQWSCGSEVNDQSPCEPASQVGFGLRIRQPDGTTSASYLEGLTALPSGTVSVAEAREFSGQQRFSTLDGDVFVESLEAPRITRFRNCGVDDFREHETINFSALGLQRAGITRYFDSTTAVSFGLEEPLLVEFDPSQMRITRQTSISELLPPDFNVETVNMIVRDGTLFLVVAYRFGLEIFPEITVGIVDLGSFTLAEIVRDTRCAFPTQAYVDEDGFLYVQGDGGFNTLRPDLASCLVRIPPNSTAFDDFLFDMAPFVEGRGTSGAAYVGDGQVLTFALYPELVDPNDPTSVALDPVRRAWLIDYGADTPSGTEIAGLPFTRIPRALDLDGRLLLTTSQSFQSTEVYEVDVETVSGALAFSTEGQAINIFSLD